MKNDPN